MNQSRNGCMKNHEIVEKLVNHLFFLRSSFTLFRMAMFRLRLLFLLYSRGNGHFFFTLNLSRFFSRLFLRLVYLLVTSTSFFGVYFAKWNENADSNNSRLEIEITTSCYPYQLFCSYWIKLVIPWCTLDRDEFIFFFSITWTFIMQLKCNIKWNNLFSFTIPDCFAPHHDEIELHKVLSICYKNCNERCRVKYCNCLKIENRPKLELNGFCFLFFCFALLCMSASQHKSRTLSNRKAKKMETTKLK